MLALLPLFSNHKSAFGFGPQNTAGKPMTVTSGFFELSLDARDSQSFHRPMSSGGTVPLKLIPVSACMEPVTETFRSLCHKTQVQQLGYALPDTDGDSYREVSRFGGEMMRSSIESLERAMGTDAEGQPTSSNAYVTTGRGGPINVDRLPTPCVLCYDGRNRCRH